MNIWHGLTASSMNAFFHWEQELQGSKLELAFLTNAQPTTGQSGDELVGVYAAKFCSSNNRLVPFFFWAFCGPISGVKIWTQNWVYQVAQQFKPGSKLDPVFGSPKLALLCSWGQLDATVFLPVS